MIFCQHVLVMCHAIIFCELLSNDYREVTIKNPPVVKNPPVTFPEIFGKNKNPPTKIWTRCLVRIKTPLPNRREAPRKFGVFLTAKTVSLRGKREVLVPAARSAAIHEQCDGTTSLISSRIL